MEIVRVSMSRDDLLALGESLDALLAVEQGDEAVDLALKLAKIRGDHDDADGAGTSRSSARVAGAPGRHAPARRSRLALHPRAATGGSSPRRS